MGPSRTVAIRKDRVRCHGCHGPRARSRCGDFALWRAREANAEVRAAYERALAAGGRPPAPEQLAELRQLEQQAETKYRDLRAFLREHFEQLAVLA